MDLTVAICTKNRRKSVLRTLRSLLTQRWDGSFEILIVDNGSEDRTAEAMRRCADRCGADLVVVTEPKPGLASARNRALEVARGSAIVFADDDVDCVSGWLAAHGDAFRDERVIGTGGPILPIFPDGTSDWFRRVASSEFGGPAARYDLGADRVEIEPGGQPTPFGGNMGVRRAAAIEAGGFRAALGWGPRMIPSEEPDMFKRLQQQDGIILYLPHAEVGHRLQPEKTTHEYWRKWQRGYGRSTVLMAPPTGVLSWFSETLRSVARAGKWRAVAYRAGWSDDADAQTRALREHYRAAGRFLQLMGV